MFLNAVFNDKEDYYFEMWDTRWRSWLSHYATSRKVAGSSPDVVIFQLT
jgi:hypothetical protein